MEDPTKEVRIRVEAPATAETPITPPVQENFSSFWKAVLFLSFIFSAASVYLAFGV